MGSILAYWNAGIHYMELKVILAGRAVNEGGTARIHYMELKVLYIAIVAITP